LKDSGCVFVGLLIRLLEPGNKVMQQQPVCTHLLSLIWNIFCLVEKRCTCSAIQYSPQVSMQFALIMHLFMSLSHQLCLR
jgi:hypothetical protein